MMENKGRRRSLAGLGAAPSRRTTHQPATEQTTHKNAETDALVEQGRRALEFQQYEKARTLLRRAMAQAPFRGDIKDLLASALDERPMPKNTAAETRPEPITLPKMPKLSLLAGVKDKMRPDMVARFAKPVILGILAIALLIGGISLVHLLGTSKPHPKTIAENPEIQHMIEQALAMSRENNYQGALSLLETARRECHDSASIDAPAAEVHDRQAIAVSEQGDYDQAITLADKALQLQPNNPRYSYDKGWNEHLSATLGHAADTAQAKTLERDACANLEHSLKVKPDDILALWAIGRSYASLDEKEKAASYFRRLIALQPSSQYALQAVTQLTQWQMPASATTQASGQ